MSSGPHLADLPLPEVPRAVVKIRVKPGVEGHVRSGHPWVYDRAVTSVTPEGPAGSLATIYDRKDRFLAVGLYDPTSPIRARMFTPRKPTRIDGDWLAATIAASVARREDFESAGTTAFRLVHGESDGLPGLVVDRYDDCLVVKIYTCAWVPHLMSVLAGLAAIGSWRSIVLRLPRGLRERPADMFGLVDGMTLAGATAAEAVGFLENGLRFEADLVRGQKTGFFLDQRENRARVRALAPGARVLNVCCYTGGFSVYAAAGGATRIVSLDASRPALDGVARNLALNQSLAQVPHEVLKADAFEGLAQLAEEGQRFDLVILDPPAFASKSSDLSAASAAYRKLNGLGAALVVPGGHLVTCSCTAYITAEMFEDIVMKSVGQRDFQVTGRHGAPADHPATFPEAHYLKALYLEGATDQSTPSRRGRAPR